MNQGTDVVRRFRSFNTSTSGPATCRWFARVIAEPALVQASWGTIDGGWRERWEYEPGRAPIVVEDHASHGSHRTPTLILEEITAFRVAVRKLPTTREQARVLDHLIRTRFIVVASAPEPADQSCRRTALTLLGSFVDQYGGLIHVEDEGFYDGEHLFLATPGLRCPFEELPEKPSPFE
jgi:hypothetical protein